MSARPIDSIIPDTYGQLLEEFGGDLREPRAAYGGAGQNVREEIVRCLWFGGHFSPDALATDDGRRLEVLSPGWWNVEGGPDFIRAELLLEGIGRLVGDVEVHVRAGDWFAHGHGRQPAYNNVVLHVAMWNDAEGREVRLEDGRTVPQLTLSPLVEDEIEDLVEVVDLEGPPQAGAQAVPGRYCGDALAAGEMSHEWLGRFLDCAGDHRLLTRAERMRDACEKETPEQVLYERVAEAMGFKNNRLPFLQMAAILPVARLRQVAPLDADADRRQSAVEAAMFGVAGFLDEPPPDGADAETVRYIEGLRSLWAAMPAELHERRMSRAHWSFAGTRPVNHPPRRIAALAALYGRHLCDGLFRHLARAVGAAAAERRRSLERAIRRQLVETFTDPSHGYWSARCSFGGRKLPRPAALLGAERAQAVVVDVVLPLLLTHAAAEGDEEMLRRVHMVWQGLPKRSADSVVRRMSQVLFQDGAQGAVTASERRQQGLHQIHRDFCSAEEGCLSCLLYRVHQAGRKLDPV